MCSRSECWSGVRSIFVGCLGDDSKCGEMSFDTMATLKTDFSEALLICLR